MSAGENADSFVKIFFIISDCTLKPPILIALVDILVLLHLLLNP